MSGLGTAVPLGVVFCPKCGSGVTSLHMRLAREYGVAYRKANR